MERRIEYLRDLKSGAAFHESEIFARSEKDVFELRRLLAECNAREEVWYVCDICSQPVYLAGKLFGEYYFKHFQERGNCPIKTKGRLSQEEIDRFRFHGQRESIPHIEAKEFLKEIISKDSDFTDVKAEAFVRSTVDPTRWRRPDISCSYKGRKIVFEIQLSTTYLNVIVERELHYREDKTFVIWLFDKFDIENLRFVHKDIYYSNHGNAFVIDGDARRRSREAGALIVHCYRHISASDTTEEIWLDDFVSLDQLTFDEKFFRAYYTDMELDQLRAEFEGYWLAKGNMDYDARLETKRRLVEKLWNRGFFFDESAELSRMLDALYSLKTGQMIGFRYEQDPIARLTHHVLDQRKPFLYIYLWALEKYGHRDVIQKSDRSGNFKRKVDNFRKSRSKNEYARERRYDALFSFLFPPLAEKLQ